MPPATTHKLVIGCGYLGRRVALKWLADGHTVYATTRSPDRAEELAADGLIPLVVDISRPELAPLPAAATVLFAVGHDRQSGQSVHDVYVGGMANVLDTIVEPPERFLFTSSTGVYGQTDGSWIDEQSPCEPTRLGGRACLKAERHLAAHRLGSRAIVLRLAGLYGPGRIPRLAKLRAGEPIAAAADGQMNLIHVDDAAQCILAAERMLTPPATLLISDGHPVTRREYHRHLAELAAAPPPSFVPPAPNTHAAARATSSKRISNRQMQQQLNIQLQHPTYQHGLRAIIRE